MYLMIIATVREQTPSLTWGLLMVSLFLFYPGFSEKHPDRCCCIFMCWSLAILFRWVGKMVAGSPKPVPTEFKIPKEAFSIPAPFRSLARTLIAWLTPYGNGSVVLVRHAICFMAVESFTSIRRMRKERVSKERILGKRAVFVHSRTQHFYCFLVTWKDCILSSMRTGTSSVLLTTVSSRRSSLLDV